jgi:hypothetical protein
LPSAGERKIDVRVEPYNLLNRANFNLPGDSRSAPRTSACISSATVLRAPIQLGRTFRF